MVKEHANESTATPSLRILSVFVVGILAIALTMGPAIAETTSVERSESVDLHTGDWLSVLSSRNSLQSVEIRGNLTAAKLASAAHYPTSSFNLTSYAQGHYSIRLTFDWPSEYDVTILINESNAARKEIGSYYFSSGQLILTIDLGFRAPDPITPSTRASTWNDFASWTTRFGDAFPLWVKLLYAILGIQFVAVGYKWIRFENDDETAHHCQDSTGVICSMFGVRCSTSFSSLHSL